MMKAVPKDRVGILLVDDHPANLTALEAILKRPDYKLVTATSGAQALEKIRDEEFAVILLDVMMPGMDGFEFAALTKTVEANRRTPLIFVTAVAREVLDAAKGYDLGAADYLTKPLNEGEVKAKVGVFVDLYRSRQALKEMNHELEQRSAEKAKELAAANERFRILVEGVKEYALIQTDAAGTFITWNKGAERLLGYGASEIIGQHFRSIFTPEDIKAGVPERELGMAIANGHANDTRWHQRKDQTLFFAHGTTTALWDENHKLRGFAKVLRDETARKKAEDALLNDMTAQKESELVCREREYQLRLAVEATNLGTWDFRPKTGELKWSPRCKELFGLSQDQEVDYDAFLAAVHPEDRADAHQSVQKSLAGANGGRFDIEYRIIRGIEPRERWVRANGQTLFDDSGQAERFIGTAQDITEKKRNELFLAEQAQILDLTSDAIFIRNFDDKKIVYWNRGAEELYGWTKAEALGRVSVELLKKEFPAPFDQITAALVHHGRWAGEVIQRKKDGTKIIVASRWALQRCPRTGSPTKILETNTDITRRKEAEADLQRAKEAAEAANQAKSSFLANMSHELRTPLNSILGFTEFLMDDAALTDEERQDFAATIRRNCRLLAQLIDDILDLSKVEAGKLTIEKIECSLPDLLSDVRTLLAVQAQEKGIDLVINQEDFVPEKIISDPTRLKQVLLNVIGNAVKFTEEGQVSVTVKTPKSAEPSPKLIFVVTDTGIGISPAQAKNLFQPFAQADDTTTRRFGGTGLGLVLARRLARILGGDVVLADSSVGAGSTFVVTIDPGEVSGPAPLVSWTSEERSERDKMPQKLRGLKVLVAEDSPDGQYLIQRVLRNGGAEVELADNGRDVVKKALKGDFDVVLMDIQMPIMDGIKATTELRSLGYPRPVIALTAHAMREQREEAFKAGCDDHLTKPINLGELVKKLSAYGRHSEQPSK